MLKSLLSTLFGFIMLLACIADAVTLLIIAVILAGIDKLKKKWRA